MYLGSFSISTLVILTVLVPRFLSKATILQKCGMMISSITGMAN